MKFIACILSFYIMVLLAIPCADHQKDHVLQKKEMASAAHHDKDHMGDQCSPFCTCDCCVSPIIYQDYTVILDSFAILMGSYSSENPFDSVTFYSGSIWQPPQIS